MRGLPHLPGEVQAAPQAWAFLLYAHVSVRYAPPDARTKPLQGVAQHDLQQRHVRRVQFRGRATRNRSSVAASIRISSARDRGSTDCP